MRATLHQSCVSLKPSRGGLFRVSLPFACQFLEIAAKAANQVLLGR